MSDAQLGPQKQWSLSDSDRLLLEGQKEVLRLSLAQSEGVRFWLRVQRNL
jgi:hypothetical protein